MASETKPTIAANVPTQVFTAFISELSGAGVEADVAKRLHQALLEDRVFTPDGLETAMFGETTLDD